jgi:hypothetical protein
MPRTITWQLYVDWAKTGSYVDESARLVSASGSQRVAAPEQSMTASSGTADRLTVVLRNDDGRYSPYNSGGALYTYLLSGGVYHAPMYLNISINGGADYARVFTGVIKLPAEQTPTYNAASTVTLDCRSRDELLLNARASTLMSDLRTMHDDGYNEEQIIAKFLTDAGMVDGTDFVSQAHANPSKTLARGMFAIPWAWLDDESPLDEIWRLAAACGGRFYCNHAGKFVYENMHTWLTDPYTTVKKTFGLDDYSEFVPYYNDRELYNRVTVEVAPRVELMTNVLWEPDETIVVPANSTKRIVARLRQPAFRIDAIGYIATHAGRRVATSALTVNMTQYAQRVVMDFTNASTTFAVEVVDFQLVGVSINGGPTQEEIAESSHAFWTSYPTIRPGRTRALRGNVYIQSAPQAQALASFLRDRCQLPRLFFRLNNCPGDPALHIGDRINLAHPDSWVGPFGAQILSITWSLDANGFRQSFEAADKANLYPYDEYFILGTTVAASTLGVGSFRQAPIFY